MIEKENEGYKNLQENLKSLEDLEKLESVDVNLKSLNITSEDEHITISFNKEDIEQIKAGNTQFMLVSGRRS